MQQFFDTVMEIAAKSGLKILASIAFVIIGLKLVRLLVKLLCGVKGFKKVEPSAQSFLRSFLSITLNTLIFITAAGILGVPTTSMLAVLGSAGLAVGLALQGGLANFAGGLMILIFKPFKVEDFIETQDKMGVVKEITIFYTTLNTIDNKKVIIPNGQVSNASVINYSAEPIRRVDLEFTVSYDSDIDKVKEILLDAANRHPLVRREPAEPFARLKEHADNALVFVMRAWVETPDYWTFYFDMMEGIKKEFDRQGITIPFPQMDVHLDELRKKSGGNV